MNNDDRAGILTPHACSSSSATHSSLTIQATRRFAVPSHRSASSGGAQDCFSKGACHNSNAADDDDDDDDVYRAGAATPTTDSHCTQPTVSGNRMTTVGVGAEEEEEEEELMGAGTPQRRRCISTSEACHSLFFSEQCEANDDEGPSLSPLYLTPISVCHPVVVFLSSLQLQGFAPELIHGHGIATVDLLLAAITTETAAMTVLGPRASRQHIAELWKGVQRLRREQRKLEILQEQELKKQTKASLKKKNERAGRKRQRLQQNGQEAREDEAQMPQSSPAVVVNGQLETGVKTRKNSGLCYSALREASMSIDRICDELLSGLGGTDRDSRRQETETSRGREHDADREALLMQKQRSIQFMDELAFSSEGSKGSFRRRRIVSAQSLVSDTSVSSSTRLDQGQEEEKTKRNVITRVEGVMVASGSTVLANDSERGGTVTGKRSPCGAAELIDVDAQTDDVDDSDDAKSDEEHLQQQPLAQQGSKAVDEGSTEEIDVSCIPLQNETSEIPSQTRHDECEGVVQTAASSSVESDWAAALHSFLTGDTPTQSGNTSQQHQPLPAPPQYSSNTSGDVSDGAQKRGHARVIVERSGALSLALLSASMATSTAVVGSITSSASQSAGATSHAAAALPREKAPRCYSQNIDAHEQNELTEPMVSSSDTNSIKSLAEATSHGSITDYPAAEASSQGSGGEVLQTLPSDKVGATSFPPHPLLCSAKGQEGCRDLDQPPTGSLPISTIAGVNDITQRGEVLRGMLLENIAGLLSQYNLEMARLYTEQCEEATPTISTEHQYRLLQLAPLCASLTPISHMTASHTTHSLVQIQNVSFGSRDCRERNTEDKLDHQCKACNLMVEPTTTTTALASLSTDGTISNCVVETQQQQQRKRSSRLLGPCGSSLKKAHTQVRDVSLEPFIASGSTCDGGDDDDHGWTRQCDAATQAIVETEPFPAGSSQNVIFHASSRSSGVTPVRGEEDVTRMGSSPLPSSLPVRQNCMSNKEGENDNGGDFWESFGLVALESQLSELLQGVSNPALSPMPTMQQQQRWQNEGDSVGCLGPLTHGGGGASCSEVINVDELDSASDAQDECERCDMERAGEEEEGRGRLCADDEGADEETGLLVRQLCARFSESRLSTSTWRTPSTPPPVVNSPAPDRCATSFCLSPPPPPRPPPEQEEGRGGAASTSAMKELIACISDRATLDRMPLDEVRVWCARMGISTAAHRSGATLQTVPSGATVSAAGGGGGDGGWADDILWDDFGLESYEKHTQVPSGHEDSISGAGQDAVEQTCRDDEAERGDMSGLVFSQIDLLPQATNESAEGVLDATFFCSSRSPLPSSVVPRHMPVIGDTSLSSTSLTSTAISTATAAGTIPLQVSKRRATALERELLCERLWLFIVRARFFACVAPALLHRVPRFSGLPYKRVRATDLVAARVDGADPQQLVLTRDDLEQARQRAKLEEKAEAAMCVVAALAAEAVESTEAHSRHSLSGSCQRAREKAEVLLDAHQQQQQQLKWYERVLLMEPTDPEAVATLVQADFPFVSHTCVQQLLLDCDIPLGVVPSRRLTPSPLPPQSLTPPASAAVAMSQELEEHCAQGDRSGVAALTSVSLLGATSISLLGEAQQSTLLSPARSSRPESSPATAAAIQARSMSPTERRRANTRAYFASRGIPTRRGFRGRGGRGSGGAYR